MTLHLLLSLIPITLVAMWVVYQLVGQEREMDMTWLEERIDSMRLFIRKMLHITYLRRYQVKPYKAATLGHLKRLIRSEMYMFGTHCDLNHIDVSLVTSLERLFWKTNFRGDISRWHVSQVTNMSMLFSDSSFNGDISQWDTSNVRDMTSMFAHSSFNGDISKWNVGQVIYMSSMFMGSKFNSDISQWNTSKVIHMESMFRNSKFNGDISEWDVSNVVMMGHMFERSVFQGDISKWDISNASAMNCMFQHSEFNGDLSCWKPLTLQFAQSLFFGATYPLVLHVPNLEQLVMSDFSCSQWSPCALSYWCILRGDFQFPDEHPLQESFESLRLLCANLKMTDIEAAHYIYQQLHEGMEPSYSMELEHAHHLF